MDSGGTPYRDAAAPSVASACSVGDGCATAGPACYGAPARCLTDDGHADGQLRACSWYDLSFGDDSSRRDSASDQAHSDADVHDLDDALWIASAPTVIDYVDCGSADLPFVDGCARRAVDEFHQPAGRPPDGVIDVEAPQLRCPRTRTEYNRHKKQKKRAAREARRVTSPSALPSPCGQDGDDGAAVAHIGACDPGGDPWPTAVLEAVHEHVGALGATCSEQQCINIRSRGTAAIASTLLRTGHVGEFFAQLELPPELEPWRCEATSRGARAKSAFLMRFAGLLAASLLQRLPTFAG